MQKTDKIVRRENVFGERRKTEPRIMRKNTNKVFISAVRRKAKNCPNVKKASAKVTSNVFPIRQGIISITRRSLPVQIRMKPQPIPKSLVRAARKSWKKPRSVKRIKAV